MQLRDFLAELGTDLDGNNKELNYTIIVVDEDSNEFHGVKGVRFNHDDRNVTIETY